MDMQKLMAKINAKKKELVKNERPATPKPGTNKIVLLPGWNPVEPEIFWREYGAHYIKDATNKTAAFYPCDEVIYGTECPVCKALAQASRMTNDDATLDMIKRARAGRQFLVNAIVIGENGNAPTPYALSKTAFESIMNVIGAWGSAIFDPQNPQVIQIDRNGTGFDTRYMVTVTPEKFPLPPDTMSKVRNLDDYVNQRSETLAKKAVFAIGGLAGASAAMLGWNEAEAPRPQIAQAPAQTSAPAYAAPQPAPQTQTYVPPAQPVQPAPAPQPSPAPMWTPPPASYPTAQPVQNAAPASAPQSVPLDAEMQSLLDSLDGI